MMRESHIIKLPNQHFAFPLKFAVPLFTGPLEVSIRKVTQGEAEKPAGCPVFFSGQFSQKFGQKWGEARTLGGI